MVQNCEGLSSDYVIKAYNINLSSGCRNGCLRTISTTIFLLNFRRDDKLPLIKLGGNVVAKSNILPITWATARSRWESEPTCTYSDLIEFLGVSKQAIAKKAHLDGWSKHLDMARIVAMAHQKADRTATAENTEKSASLSEPTPRVVHPEDKPTGQPEIPNNRNDTDQSAAVTARAALLERHRSEWVATRNLLYMAIKAKDFELSRTAKNAVDTMHKIQQGERAAWNLDTTDENPVLQIIIERTPGFRIVR